MKEGIKEGRKKDRHFKVRFISRSGRRQKPQAMFKNAVDIDLFLRSEHLSKTSALNND